MVNSAENIRCLLALQNNLKKRKTRLQQSSANQQELHSSLQVATTRRRRELQLENTKNPFEGGLRMACILGKSKRTRRSFLSGGEKSMAALAFVSQSKITNQVHFTTLTSRSNLDPFNAERIATLCRIRSITLNSSW